MIEVRKSHERGHANHGWLESHHTFSFAGYFDPRHMGVSDLLVINDDRVKPKSGFDTHPHRDMEIVSYVLEGEIEHRDTMGFHTLLKAGEVQVMSAGSGIRHSEYNASQNQALNFLQIWIKPREAHLKPDYAQKDFSAVSGLGLIVSPDGEEGSLPINQDTRIYKLSIHRQTIAQTTSERRTYYLHLARGAVSVNGIELQAGDGATITQERFLKIEALGEAEGLLFELR